MNIWEAMENYKSIKLEDVIVTFTFEDSLEKLEFIVQLEKSQAGTIYAVYEPLFLVGGCSCHTAEAMGVSAKVYATLSLLSLLEKKMRFYLANRKKYFNLDMGWRDKAPRNADDFYTFAKSLPDDDAYDERNYDNEEEYEKNKTIAMFTEDFEDCGNNLFVLKHYKVADVKSMPMSVEELRELNIKEGYEFYYEWFCTVDGNKYEVLKRKIT